MEKIKIYLAGPDVFRKDPAAMFEAMKRLAAGYGIEAFSPFDGSLEKVSAETIFDSNLSIIRQVDVVVANLVPFRGLCIDDGTSFEIGYAYASGKRVMGYSAFSAKSTVQLASELDMFLDPEFPDVEDFGHPCNLMIAQAILNKGGKIFDSFENCLKFMNDYGGSWLKPHNK